MFVNSKFFLFLRNSFVSPILKPIWRKYYQKSRHRKFKKYAKEALKKIKTTLDENNATFWLDFGTLLGAIRVSGFLSHDCDMDLGAFASQSDLVSKAIKSDPMFVVSHEYFVDDSLAQLSFEYKGLNIDIAFYHHDEKDNHFIYNYICYFDKELSKDIDGNEYKVAVMRSTVPFAGTKSIRFNEMEVNIPSNAESYLEADYGPDYMIPNKNWDYLNDAPNTYKYPSDELFGICVLNK